MLGTYRLCLAILVALSHIGVQVHGLNPGVFAVVGFYLVSGYVMTGLLRVHYTSPAGAGRFYLDRGLRLLPHYAAVAVVTLAWFAVTGNHTEYLRRAPGAGDLLNNALIVPMNYYMFNHSDDFALIPPAWSLGAEVQFYIVFPFILLLGGPRLRLGAMVASVAVYLIAAFGVINSDWFGYRLLPGVLFVFLLGSMLYDLHHSGSGGTRAWLVPIIAAAFAFSVAVILAYRGKLVLPYNRETLAGLVAGTLIVHVLAPRTRHRLDDALGNLSYGVFLNHFLMQWAFFGGKVDGAAAAVAYICGSIFTAGILYYVIERPVLRMRHRLRASRAMASTQRLQVARR